MTEDEREQEEQRGREAAQRGTILDNEAYLHGSEAFRAGYEKEQRETMERVQAEDQSEED